MSKRQSNINDRLLRVQQAWEIHDATATFGGLTLEAFRALAAESQKERDEVAHHRQALSAAIGRRLIADRASVQALRQVANGVRGSAAHGDNSALYRAMGYIPWQERKSGLTRKGQTGQNQAAG